MKTAGFDNLSDGRQSLKSSLLAPDTVGGPDCYRQHIDSVDLAKLSFRRIREVDLSSST